MLGAALGACTGCGKSGFESLADSPIWPLKGAGGTGSRSWAARTVRERRRQKQGPNGGQGHGVERTGCLRAKPCLPAHVRDPRRSMLDDPASPRRWGRADLTFLVTRSRVRRHTGLPAARGVADVGTDNISPSREKRHWWFYCRWMPTTRTGWTRMSERGRFRPFAPPRPPVLA